MRAAAARPETGKKSTVNRYPIWVYVTVAVAVVLGLLYTLPNFFGESPAVQVSSARATLKVDTATLGRVEEVLKQANITYTGVHLDAVGVKVRFADTDTQLKAKDLIAQALNPDPQNPSYTVALNLLSSSPTWLTRFGALPMYLGLDLRGGVHFLLQVDMKGALTKRLDAFTGDIRTHAARQEHPPLGASRARAARSSSDSATPRRATRRGARSPTRSATSWWSTPATPPSRASTRRSSPRPRSASRKRRSSRTSARSTSASTSSASPSR